MIDFDKTSNKEQGDLGEAAAIMHYTFENYKVFKPLQESSCLDLILADNDCNLQRVQVKTTQYKTEYGYFRVTLATRGGNRSGANKTKYFDPSKVDLLFVLTEDGDCYSIPTSEISSTATLNLNDRFKPCRKI